MKIGNLDYLATLDSNNLSARSPSRSLTGGLGVGRLFWFAMQDESGSSVLQLSADDLSSFWGQTLSPSGEEICQIDGLKISEISVITENGLTSRSVAGSGFLGNSRFSFAASSANASL